MSEFSAHLPETIHRSASREAMNPFPQSAPGSGPSGPTGHIVENSIPLSIFPIQADKVCLCFCGKPARGKTLLSRRVARYLTQLISVHFA